MAQINWAQVYDPRIHIGGTQFQLPLPILRLSERFSTNFKETKVPLRDGVTLTGVTRGSLTVTLNGLISTNTRSGLLHKKQRMQDILINNGGASFTFYRYFDSVRQNFRWYPDCICKDLSFTPVHNQVYTMEYQMSIVVPSGLERELITTVGELPSSDLLGNTSGYIAGGVFKSDDDSDIAAQADALPANRTLLHGPLVIKLNDSAGESSFLVQNSDGDYIFRIDSDGFVQTTLPFAVVPSITWP